MTRKELIESREYLKINIGLLLGPNFKNKKRKKKAVNLMINFLLEHRDEWLQLNKEQGVQASVATGA